MNTYEIINTYFKGKDPEPLIKGSKESSYGS